MDGCRTAGGRSSASRRRRRCTCRQRRRKKKHLIEAAPFGRLDQMLRMAVQTGSGGTSPPQPNIGGSLRPSQIAPRTSRTTSTFGTQQACSFDGEALGTKLMRACVRPQACFSAACSSAAASMASRPHAPAAKSHPEACLKSIQRAVTSQVRLNSLHFHPRWHINAD